MDTLTYEPVIQSADAVSYTGIESRAGVSRTFKFPSDPSACKHFIGLWPEYFEQSLSVSNGRRLSKEKLEGCVNINLHDLIDAVIQLGYSEKNILPEPKRYPRKKDCWVVSGRLRVELADKEGNPVVSSILTKEALLVKIAQVIPAMASRKQRNEEFEKFRKLELERRQIAEKQAGGAQAAVGGKGKKK